MHHLREVLLVPCHLSVQEYQDFHCDQACRQHLEALDYQASPGVQVGQSVQELLELRVLLKALQLLFDQVDLIDLAVQDFPWLQEVLRNPEYLGDLSDQENLEGLESPSDPTHRNVEYNIIYCTAAS